SPAPDTIVTQPSVNVFGATEADAALDLNGDTLGIADDGSFERSVDLHLGDNEITVLARDLAGNQSTRRLNVVYRPAATVDITLSDQIPRVGASLATRSDKLSVQGVTNANPGSAVLVRAKGGAELVRTLVEMDGQVQFVVPAGVQPQEYSIEILAPGGAIEGQLTFTTIQDQDPPAIVLDLPPPRVTGDLIIHLHGTASDAATLEMNGTQVPLADGRFDLALTLNTGENKFDLVASDATGNVRLTHLEVLLDVDPPEILRTVLHRPKGISGSIELEVEATDASGLRQAAPYVISIGGIERDGFLRCDAISQLCRASLPPESGELKLIELIIEDYAGNTAFQ
ncbi:MAG: hypothetical protein ACI8R4_002932, partial [Paracoccaceae bacterium]